MSTTLIYTVLAPLAFIVGFALQRGNVCSVLAARQIVWTGRWSRLRGLLLASAWGFAFLMPLAWFDIGTFALCKQVTPGIFTVLAGIAYAVGCYINGACIFGICSRVTAGHISFVFAIPAMAVGAALGQHSGFAPKPSGPSVATTASDSVPLQLLWVAILIWLGWATYKMIERYRSAGVTLSTVISQSRWRAALAAAIIGTLGALLFATDTGWFYPAAAKRLALYAVGLTSALPLDSLVGAGALFVGGFVAGLYKGRFVVRPPHLIPSIKAIVGGLIIGFAWAFIPGGNDAMVLYMLPSLALNGIVAYVAMFLTLIGIEHLKRQTIL